MQILLEVATIWSRQHVAEPQLIVFTRALGRGLVRLGSEVQNYMQLLTTIFEGVSTHLSTPPSVTRQVAESIAALTAHLTAPDITPPFANTPPAALGIGADWLTVVRHSPAEKTSTGTGPTTVPEIGKTTLPRAAKSNARALREVDPDQLYLNVDEERQVEED